MQTIKGAAKSAISSNSNKNKQTERSDCMRLEGVILDIDPALKLNSSGLWRTPWCVFSSAESTGNARGPPLSAAGIPVSGEMWEWHHYSKTRTLDGGTDGGCDVRKA